MRVLHYGMGPNLGGIETYLLNLARALDAEVYSDFLYSDNGKLPVFAADLPKSQFFGVTPRRVSPRRNGHDLEELFTKERFDILHFHANTASYVAPVTAALRHGVRVLFHSHSAGVSRSRVTRALHQWNRLILSWDKIAKAAVSGEAGRWMFGSWPFQVIPNGIDAAAFVFDLQARSEVRAELGIADNAMVVGSVAAFLPAKNHAFLLQVFAEVAKRHPDAHLVLVGAGPLEPWIRDRTTALGLRNRVLLLGRRPDVPRVLSALDCLLFPSLHEGFGLIALEAQASGLPVVASDRVPRDALVVADLCRILSLDADPASWAEAVLAGSPTGRRAEAAAMVAKTGLSLQEVADRVSALYRRLAA